MARALLVLLGLLSVTLLEAKKPSREAKSSGIEARIEEKRSKCYNFYKSETENCESYTACLEFISLLLNQDTEERYSGFDKLSILTTLKHTTELFAGREGKAKWMYCYYPPGLSKAYAAKKRDKRGNLLIKNKYYFAKGDRLETMRELVWNIKALLFGKKNLTFGGETPEFSYPNFLHWKKRVLRSIADYGRVRGSKIYRETEQYILNDLEAMEKFLKKKLKEGNGKAKVPIYTDKDFKAAVKVIEPTAEEPNKPDTKKPKKPKKPTPETGEEKEIEIFKEAAKEVVEETEEHAAKNPKKPAKKPTKKPEKKPETKPEKKPEKKPDKKPDDTKPDDTKPDDTKPEDTKPDDTKPDDTKPDDTKPDDTKPDDTKPDDTKPDDTKPDDTKPDDTKPDDSNPADEDEPEDTTGEADEDHDEDGYLVMDLEDMENADDLMADFENPTTLHRSRSAVELAPDFEDIDEAQLRRSNSVGLLFG